MVYPTQRLLEERSRFGPHYLYVDPVITVDDRVTLTRSPDPNHWIPVGRSRPTTGDYLGESQGGVEISYGLQYSKSTAGTTPNGYKATITAEDFKVTGNILSNGSSYIRRLFEPPGLKSAYSSYAGGETEFEEHSLLILMHNYFKSGYVECWLFFNGFFNVNGFRTGSVRNLETISMEFVALDGMDPETPTCLRPAGQRVYHRWYEDPVTGLLVDPDEIETDSYGSL